MRLSNTPPRCATTLGPLSGVSDDEIAKNCGAAGIEGGLERIDCDVVQQRRERVPLPLPCGLPYAFQPLGHAIAALSPSRAVGVPVGPRPWTTHSAAGALAVFAGFIATTARSDLSSPRNMGVGSSPSRCGHHWRRRERACMPMSPTPPGRPGACDDAPGRVAFRFNGRRRHLA